MRAIGALARDAGLRVVEASGWTDRGRTWSTLRPEYVVCHHTAATIDVDRVLIDGRSDLPGPLCNFALHGDDTVVLIASGLANHAGVATISSDQAYGIEATGPTPAGAFGPAAFSNYDAYIVLVAAIRLHHGWGTGRVVGHKEIARPLGRKIDPSFDMTAFRAAVTQRVANWGLTEEDDMPYKDWDQDSKDALLADLRRLLTTRPGTYDSGSIMSKIVDIQGGVDRIEPLTLAMKTRVEAVESDVDTLIERTEPPA